MQKQMFAKLALLGGIVCSGVMPTTDVTAQTKENATVQTQTQTQVQAQTKSQEQIYGSQLMTRQERITFRNRLRAAKTAEEREQIRLEHHKQMQQRAKERGVTLPDTPPPVGGGGMRMGSGPGGGAGPRR